MEGDAFETVASNVWEEESPTEESESNKATTVAIGETSREELVWEEESFTEEFASNKATADVIGENSYEELESYLGERQTEGAFVERKNTVVSMFNIESEEGSSEDSSFEVDGAQETKTRCRISVLLLLVIIFAAFGIETYFFVKVLHERDNFGYEVRKLRFDNERLTKAYSDLEKRSTKAYSDLEQKSTKAYSDLEQRSTKDYSDLKKILTKANQDLEQKLTEANSDLDKSKSECDEWRNVFDNEGKKRKEHEREMQTLKTKNDFIECIKQISHNDPLIRNYALYAAVYAKSIDTIKFLLQFEISPCYEVFRCNLKQSALQRASSESSEASSNIMALLCKKQISGDQATESLNIYIKTNSPDIRIVRRLIDKNAMPIHPDLQYRCSTNTFTIALRNANVDNPIYQALVRAVKIASFEYELLKDAYILKTTTGGPPQNSLGNLIQALEIMNDQNTIQSLQHQCHLFSRLKYLSW